MINRKAEIEARMRELVNLSYFGDGLKPEELEELKKLKAEYNELIKEPE